MALFYCEDCRLGEEICRRPVPVICAALVFTALGCAGLPFLRLESNAIKLWIPQHSDFSTNYAWLWGNFPPEFRQHSAIIHGQDILTPAAIQKVN